MPQRQLNVTYHHEGDSWWAESDDLAGFSAAADSLAETRRLVRDGVQFAVGADVEVDLREADSDGHPVQVAEVVVNIAPATWPPVSRQNPAHPPAITRPVVGFSLAR